MPQHTEAEQEKASIERLTTEFAAIKGQGTGSTGGGTRPPQNVSAPPTPLDSAIFRAPETGQGASAPSISSQGEDVSLGEELSQDQSSFLEDFLPRAAVFMAGVLTGAPGQELAAGLGMLGQMSVAQREREQQEFAESAAEEEAQLQKDTLEVQRTTADAQAKEIQRANIAREKLEGRRVGIYGALSESQIATAQQDTIRNDKKFNEIVSQNRHLLTAENLDRGFAAAVQLEELRQGREALGLSAARNAIADRQIKASGTPNERLKIAVLKMYNDAQGWSENPIDFNTWAQRLPADILSAFKLEKNKPGDIPPKPEGVKKKEWYEFWKSDETPPQFIGRGIPAGSGWVDGERLSDGHAYNNVNGRLQLADAVTGGPTSTNVVDEPEVPSGPELLTIPQFGLDFEVKADSSEAVTAAREGLADFQTEVTAKATSFAGLVSLYDIFRKGKWKAFIDSKQYGPAFAATFAAATQKYTSTE